MSIIGAVAKFFRTTPKPKTAVPKGGPGGGYKTYTLEDLAMAATAAGAMVGERADWLWQQSQQRGGQYLSQRGPAVASTALQSIASKIPMPPNSGLGYMTLRALGAKFDQGYQGMMNGQGWAAYPNSGQIDNMEGLQEIAAQLQADAAQIAAAARQLAQQAGQGGGHASRAPSASLRAPTTRAMSPSGMQALAHLSAGSPKLQRQARKVIVGAMIENYGPNRTYEMLGEDMWEWME